MQATTANPAATNADLLDKISDFIPGAAGEKLEEFTKGKLGGFFEENKESDK